VICTLGNFSTKLLREDPTGITRLHGQPEVLVVGRRAVRIYPIFHPAAALYTPRMLQTLREDFQKLPDVLALPEPEQPQSMELPEMPEVAEGPVQATGSGVAGEPAVEADQLGLF
jgi:uracil-DNA glycosylase